MVMRELLGIVLFMSIIFCILAVYVVRHRKQAKKRKKIFAKKVTKLLQNISIREPSQKILEYDKVLDLCLKEKGLQGTTGEKMKKYSRKKSSGFLNTNSIWIAHKLRNKIAHEIDFEPSAFETKQAEKSFRQEILFLIDG